MNIFVVGVGTGVTIIGVSQYLKEQNQAVQIVVVEPRDSTTLSGGRAGVHKIQDIGAGYVPEVLDASVYDEIILVGKAFLHCHIAHQLINAAVQDIGQQRQNRNIRQRTSIFPLGNSLKGYPYLFGQFLLGQPLLLTESVYVFADLIAHKIRPFRVKYNTKGASHV